jgi:osmotically-inducible protein OsmY
MGSSLSWQTDRQLQQAVQRQLDWDPEIDARTIAVIAADGVITLTGSVRSYATKVAAEQSAKRVRGVRGVANDIQVVPLPARTDTEIATDAVRALRARADLPLELKVTARNGVLILEGVVHWAFQKVAAGAVLTHLESVKGVSNQIVVTPSVSVGEVKADIEEALVRCADVDAKHIDVRVEGSVVTLSGTVTSCHEKEEAERAAAAAPGITHVDNRIVIGSLREALSGRSQ